MFNEGLNCLFPLHFHSFLSSFPDSLFLRCRSAFLLQWHRAAWHTRCMIVHHWYNQVGFEYQIKKPSWMLEVYLLHLFFLLSCDQGLGKEILSKWLQWEFTESLQICLQIAAYRFLSLPSSTSCIFQEEAKSVFLGCWVCLGVYICLFSETMMLGKLFFFFKFLDNRLWPLNKFSVGILGGKYLFIFTDFSL